MTTDAFVNVVICLMMFVWIAMAMDALGRL